MTRPTPILVLKSPLPTEESNLDIPISRDSRSTITSNLLVALILWLVRLVKPAGVLHGDGVSLAGLVGAVALFDDGLLDTHDEFVYDCLITDYLAK